MAADDSTASSASTTTWKSSPLSPAEEADVRAKVDFDLALKRAQGNHFSMDSLSFKGVELTRKPEWMKQLGEAISANTTCTALDLSESALSDTALQQLAMVLALPSRCAKLRKLDLRGNPALTVMGETVARGLCKLRPGLELLLGDELDATAEGFGCDRQLVEGLTAWPTGDLAVPGKQNAYYCPKEIAGEGVLIELKQGFQGPNGVKFKCDLATFELYHTTGSMVLKTLASSQGVEV